MANFLDQIPLKYRILGVITSAVVLLDQWTKHLIHYNLKWAEMRPIFPEYFHITYFQNRGAAFSLFENWPAWIREPFFLSVPVVAVLVILFLSKRLGPQQKATQIAFALILGGTIGNLIDRVQLGYVVDFLYFHWKTVYYWPAFNVADMCIVCGVGILFVQSFRRKPVATTEG